MEATTSERWRLIDTPPAPGAWNMAVDEVLMESVRSGGAPVLRVYRWAPACVSLGRNQPARDRYDADRLAEAGIHAVRRLTGGRAVLHEHELTYAVIVPAGHLGSPREGYAAINRALVAGLRLLGVEAGLQPRTNQRAAVPSLAPCFREPAEGEVVVSGRKLIGSAQYHEADVMLQHGSLLLSGDQRRLSSLVRGAPAPDDEAPAVLADLLPALPGWYALVDALVSGFGASLEVNLVPGVLTPTETDRAAGVAGRYGDVAWTWRL